MNYKETKIKKKWKKPCLTVISILKTREGAGIGDDGGSPEEGS